MQISITIPTDDFQKIRDHCREEGKTISGFLRRCALREIRTNGTVTKAKSLWGIFQ